MRTTLSLALMIMGAVLLPRAGLALQPDSPPQQTSLQNKDSLANDQPHNSNSDTQPGDDRPTVGRHATHEQSRRAGAIEPARHRTPINAHASQISSHPVHPLKTPAAITPKLGATENTAGMYQVAPTSNSVPIKAVNRHAAPVPATVALNGQQFRSARDPGAHLASIGGPLTATRGMAAINGTNTKRKP